MAGRDAFGALLLSLRDAPGLLPRLQRIAGSLGVLKRLGPRQRTVLLRMAGLGGAEPLLEHLIAGDERTREAFERLLDDFEERPEKLSEVVRGLLDPVQRPEAAAALVRALEEAVEEGEVEAEAGEDEETAEAEEAAGEVAHEERAEKQAPEGAPDEGRPVGDEEPELGLEPGPEPSSEPSSEPSLEQQPRPAPPPPPAPPTPPTPDDEIQPPRASEPMPATAVARAVAPAAALGSLGGEPAPPPRLRRPDELRPPTEAPPSATPAAVAPEDGPLAELAARLRDEAPAWAHRRALQAWIEAAEPPDLAAGLDRILELIDTLGSPSDRMWCLTSLAGGRAWDEEEWQSILDAAETSTLRRRLAHRRVATS